MELESYNYKHHGHQGKRHVSKKFLLVLAFLFVIGIIFFTSIYDGFSITGKTVSSISTNNSVALSLESTIPEMKLDGEYERIRIVGNSDKPFYAGSQKILLNKPALNELILENYSGKISFDAGNIFLIDGKVSNIILNGIPISGKNNRDMNLHMDSEIFYNSLEFNNFYLKDFNYISSGAISFGNSGTDRIRLNNEKLSILHFFGSLRIANNKMFLDGLAEKVEIKSDDRKVSISY